MELINLIKKYGGKWVAIEPDSQKIVASGISAQSVYTQATKKGVEIPTLFKVPTKYLPNVGQSI